MFGGQVAAMVKKLPDLELVLDVAEEQERALAASLRWKYSKKRIEERDARIVRGARKLARLEKRALAWLRWALGIKPWKPARIDCRLYHVEEGTYV